MMMVWCFSSISTFHIFLVILRQWKDDNEVQYSHELNSAINRIQTHDRVLDTNHSATQTLLEDLFWGSIKW